MGNDGGEGAGLEWEALRPADLGRLFPGCVVIILPKSYKSLALDRFPQKGHMKN